MRDDYHQLVNELSSQQPADREGPHGRIHYGQKQALECRIRAKQSCFSNLNNLRNLAGASAKTWLNYKSATLRSIERKTNSHCG